MKNTKSYDVKTFTSLDDENTRHNGLTFESISSTKPGIKPKLNEDEVNDYITNENPNIEKKKDVDDDEEEVDLSCGIGSFRTNIFGKYYSNLYMFAFLIGLSSVFTNMAHGVISIHLTSIERQFNIDNKIAGLLDSVSRATLLSTILFAGHFLKKSNIPKTLGISGILLGLVLMIPAVLQAVDPYELPIITNGQSNATSNSSTVKGDNANYLCEAVPLFNSQIYNNSHYNISGPKNSTEKESNQVAFVMLVTVQALNGLIDSFHAGFLPTLYMDDNMMDKSKMGIAIGIEYVMSQLAGPVGKQINGHLTKIPVDLKETEMDPKDGRFVAAWWLSFLIFGAGTAITSLPILVFPRKLLTKRQQEEALRRAAISFSGGRVEDTENSTVVKLNTVDTNSLDNISTKSGDVSNQHSKEPKERKEGRFWEVIYMLKDFPKAFVRVIKKPILLILVVDIVITSIPFNGMSMFRSIYITNEYNVSMSEVAIWSGWTALFGHLLGTILSSWISKKVSTKIGYMWIMLASYLGSVCLVPLYMIFGCDNEYVYGAPGKIGIPVNESESCLCDLDRQLISCGDDGNNYLSPCHAGCTGLDGNTFTECSLLSNTTSGSTVSPGLCPTECHRNFLIYVIIHGLQFCLSSIGSIPRRLLILRTVDSQDRGFASGMYTFCNSVIAIPAPNLFGKFIDDTCLIWDGNTCSLYDRDKIRYLVSGIDIGVNVLIHVSFFLMMMTYKLEQRKLKKSKKKATMARERDEPTKEKEKTDDEPDKEMKTI